MQLLVLTFLKHLYMIDFNEAWQHPASLPFFVVFLSDIKIELLCIHKLFGMI